MRKWLGIGGRVDYVFWLLISACALGSDGVPGSAGLRLESHECFLVRSRPPGSSTACFQYRRERSSIAMSKR